MEHNRHRTTLPELPPLAELHASHIQEQAQADGEPPWMIEQRLAAWEVFAESPPPEWPRTDLSGLVPEQIVPVAAPQGTSLTWDESLAQKGVVFCSLKTALTSVHQGRIQEHFARAIAATTHKFSALRVALWQDGVFLYVPRNVQVERPIRVRYRLADTHNAIIPYSLVIVESGAQITFIEEFASNNHSTPALAAPTTELFAAPNSHVHFVSVQHWGERVYHIGGQIVVLDQHATSTWVSVALGGSVQHVEAEAQLRGNGSTIQWHGVTFAAEQQRLLTAPWLRHIGKDTTSHMEFKTVVSDQGYSIFDGMIKIEKESSGTSTRLEEHAIHLTPGARSDSIPGLKIDTNDVAKAGHASTSGDIDEEQLFYMRSRGIPKDEAVHMIVMGFFEAALTAIPADDLRESLTAAIEAKIGK